MRGAGYGFVCTADDTIIAREMALKESLDLLDATIGDHAAK
jgi:hypothetical protein